MPVGQRAEGDLDLHGAALGRDGRGHFTDLAGGLDSRFVEQGHGNGLVAGRLHQQRFIDVEHRVAFAVAARLKIGMVACTTCPTSAWRAVITPGASAISEV